MYCCVSIYFDSSDWQVDFAYEVGSLVWMQSNWEHSDVPKREGDMPLRVLETDRGILTLQLPISNKVSCIMN